MHDPTRLCVMNMYFHGTVDFGRSLLFHCKSILSSPQEGWHRYPQCVLEEPSEPCSHSVWTCSDLKSVQHQLLIEVGASAVQVGPRAYLHPAKRPAKLMHRPKAERAASYTIQKNAKD